MPLLSPFMHGVLGLPVGFMLVFRWNNAYERWWQGRTELGLLLMHARNLGGQICTWVAPEDQQLATRALALICALKECVADRLNGTVLRDGRMVMLNAVTLSTPLHPEDLEGLFAAENKVLFCIEQLADVHLRGLEAGPSTAPPVLGGMLNEDLFGVVEAYGECEKVVNQPPPGCIITHLKSTLMVYVCTLPFILVHEVGVFAVVPTTAVLRSRCSAPRPPPSRSRALREPRVPPPVRGLIINNTRDMGQTSRPVPGSPGTSTPRARLFRFRQGPRRRLRRGDGRVRVGRWFSDAASRVQPLPHRRALARGAFVIRRGRRVGARAGRVRAGDGVALGRRRDARRDERRRRERRRRDLGQGRRRRREGFVVGGLGRREAEAGTGTPRAGRRERRRSPPRCDLAPERGVRPGVQPERERGVVEMAAEAERTLASRWAGRGLAGVRRALERVVVVRPRPRGRLQARRERRRERRVEREERGEERAASRRRRRSSAATRTPRTSTARASTPFPAARRRYSRPYKMPTWKAQTPIEVFDENSIRDRRGERGGAALGERATSTTSGTPSAAGASTRGAPPRGSGTTASSPQISHASSSVVYEPAKSFASSLFGERSPDHRGGGGSGGSGSGSGAARPGLAREPPAAGANPRRVRSVAPSTSTGGGAATARRRAARGRLRLRRREAAAGIGGRRRSGGRRARDGFLLVRVVLLLRVGFAAAVARARRRVDRRGGGRAGRGIDRGASGGRGVAVGPGAPRSGRATAARRPRRGTDTPRTGRRGEGGARRFRRGVGAKRGAKARRGARRYAKGDDRYFFSSPGSSVLVVRVRKVFEPSSTRQQQASQLAANSSASSPAAVETIDAWMTAVDLLDDGLLRHGVLGARAGVRSARSAHFLARSSPRSRPRR